MAVRNLVGVTSFNPGYEQTYLPTEAIGLLLTPRYQINKTMSVGAWQYATLELDNTAGTRYYREPTLSDTTLSFAWTAIQPDVPEPTPEQAADPAFKPDPNAHDGFTLSLQGIWGLPTSKASLAKGLYSALSLGAGARYTKKGFTASLNARGGHNFYKNTTMQYETPWLTSCVGGQGACDAFQSSGVRSPEWRLLAIGSLSYQITEKLGVSVSYGEIMDWLPSLGTTTLHGSNSTITVNDTANDQRFRALMYAGAGVEYALLDWMGVGVGYEDYYAQQKLDSTYEMPWNRYGSVYLELNFALDAIPH